jgi:hypothetical protein
MLLLVVGLNRRKTLALMMAVGEGVGMQTRS